MQYGSIVLFFMIILAPLLPAVVAGVRGGYERFQMLSRRRRKAVAADG